MGATHTAACTGWSCMPVDFPGSGGKLLVTLPLCSMEGSSCLLTSPLGSAHMGTLWAALTPHFPWHFSSKESLQGFCPCGRLLPGHLGFLIQSLKSRWKLTSLLHSCILCTSRLNTMWKPSRLMTLTLVRQQLKLPLDSFKPQLDLELPRDREQSPEDVQGSADLGLTSKTVLPWASDPVFG